MKVLVTGGSGFIGSHLVDLLLKEKYEVNVLDVWRITSSPYITFFKGSILDDYLLCKAMRDCDAVVHLAGILGTNETMFKYNPYEVAEVNVVGTAKVLHYAHNLSTKVLFASTPNVPWLNPYKVTKTACEGFVNIYRQYFGDKIVMFRFRNVYGPRERWLEMKTDAPFVYQKVIPTFIYNALTGKSLPIFGSGTQKSDYIYVEDVVKCIERAIKSKDASNPHHIPIGIGKSTSVNQLADMVLSITGSKSKKVYLPMRKGEVPVSISTDTELMRKILHVSQPINLRTGLRRTMEWIDEVLKNATS